MGRFIKNDNRTTFEVTVNGQTFLLVRPNALERLKFLEYYEDAQKRFDELPEGGVEQQTLSFERQVMIVAYFSKNNGDFEEETPEEVAQIILSEVEDFDVINDLAEKCWDNFNLKTGGSVAQAETSQES